MKIQLLGTAAATAMPLPFCNCETCREARRTGGKNLRKRSAAIINDELLIDLGPDLCTAAGMYGVDLGHVRYLVQTHSHSDHFDGGHFVTRLSDYATRNLTHLDIVCSRRTCDDMNHWVQENEPGVDLFDPQWQQDMAFSLHLIRPGETVTVGEYHITALDSGHDARVMALVYLIEHHGKNVFYGTDMLEMTPSAWNILQGRRLDAVFLDQTYGAGKNAGGHMDAVQVAGLVERMRRAAVIDAQTSVYATHISHEGNGLHAEMEHLAQQAGYHIGYDGLTLEL